MHINRLAILIAIAVDDGKVIDVHDDELTVELLLNFCASWLLMLPSEHLSVAELSKLRKCMQASESCKLHVNACDAVVMFDVGQYAACETDLVVVVRKCSNFGNKAYQQHDE